MEGCNESGVGEGERVTTGGKGRGEIGGEAGEVTGADGGMAAGKNISTLL